MAQWTVKGTLTYQVVSKYAARDAQTALSRALSGGHNGGTVTLLSYVPNGIKRGDRRNEFNEWFPKDFTKAGGSGPECTYEARTMIEVPAIAVVDAASSTEACQVAMTDESTDYIPVHQPNVQLMSLYNATLLEPTPQAIEGETVPIDDWIEVDPKDVMSLLVTTTDDPVIIDDGVIVDKGDLVNTLGRLLSCYEDEPLDHWGQIYKAL